MSDAIKSTFPHTLSKVAGKSRQNHILSLKGIESRYRDPMPLKGPLPKRLVQTQTPTFVFSSLERERGKSATANEGIAARGIEKCRKYIRRLRKVLPNVIDLDGAATSF